MKNTTIYKKEMEDWQRNASFYKKEVSSPFFLELTRKKVACYGIDTFKDKNVVDLGGGNGYFLSYLKKYCSFFGVTVDFSFEMLKSGQELFASEKNIFLDASVENIPFKTDSIDLVVLNGALHHFKASGLLRRSVEEADRILKKGGYVCIYDRNGSFLSRVFHSFAIFLKNILQKCIGKFPSSSSSAEPDFNDKDLKLFLDKEYTIKKRTFVSTLPFFLFLIFCNFIEYLCGDRVAQGARRLFIHLAKLFERILPFKWFTIEQCVFLKKE